MKSHKLNVHWSGVPCSFRRTRGWDGGIGVRNGVRRCIPVLINLCFVCSVYPVYIQPSSIGGFAVCRYVERNSPHRVHWYAHRPPSPPCMCTEFRLFLYSESFHQIKECCCAADFTPHDTHTPLASFIRLRSKDHRCKTLCNRCSMSTRSGIRGQYPNVFAWHFGDFLAGDRYLSCLRSIQQP